MSKTISISGFPLDIDGTTVDGIESLRQRIRSAIRFRLGEWFYAPTEGLDYDLILGHTTSLQQVAQVLVDAVRTEGGEEIVSIYNVEYGLDDNTRRFRFNCDVDTIYKETINIIEDIPGG